MNACSDRCGHCGRCTGGSGRERHAPFTNADFRAIEEGLKARGLSPDYFDFYDIDHLRKQGKSVEQVIEVAVQMETLAQRYDKARA